MYAAPLATQASAADRLDRERKVISRSPQKLLVPGHSLSGMATMTGSQF